MLDAFFQIGPIPANQIFGTFDVRLVILSYLVATFASYIALDITGRMRDIGNSQRSIALWLTGGAIAMGAGIWSMHFIGMLAFNMSMPMMYDPYWTALSMLVAVAASAFALFLLRPKSIRLANTIFGGVILGFAIAAMHYTGMTAMTDQVNIHYVPWIFLTSIVIAVIASEAALWMALKSTTVVTAMRARLKIVSAFIMGAAIAGMHYTGMAAAVFTPKANMIMPVAELNPEIMAIIIATVTFMILGLAFIVSTYNESVNQQMLLTARQAGMAEVAASVLHNVGNVLNSVNASTAVLSEKIQHSKLSGLQDVSTLLTQHKTDLIKFLNEDPRGADIPEYIRLLAKYWKEEEEAMLNELQSMVKNIHHIRNIIATQQDLSRVSDFEQVISIENVLEESFLISGLDNPQKNTIQLEKQYEHLKPILIDKVKLLQILVNLMQNAKESLQAASVSDKKIKVRITKNGSSFNIIVSDNGQGIAIENLTRIFGYGFTTKKRGHGFGLHSSAIAANDLGGTLKAKSAGVGKGAEFILELPYQAK